jgi:hypothetical protein
MNIIKSTATFIFFAIIFQIITQLTFAGIANGQEYNPYAQKNASFIEVPHHEAVTLPSELYYYWAKEWNRRQRATVRSRDHAITRIDTTANSGSRLLGQGTTTTIMQRVDRPAANRALIIYNPFFK